MRTKLLLLHGALGTSQQFKSFKTLLEDRFEIYELDFEGHGSSISNTEFSIQLFTENVIDFLTKESITSINIFGYSMGGYVGLNTALKYPEKVDQIVTLGTKFNWSKEAAEKEVRMLNPDKIEEKVPRFAKKLANDHAPQDWKAIVSKTANMMMNLAHGEKLTNEDLAKINHKIHIGIGSLDKMVSLEESENAAQQLSNGRLVQLDGIEHPIEKINPSEIVRYISDSFE